MTIQLFMNYLIVRSPQAMGTTIVTIHLTIKNLFNTVNKIISSCHMTRETGSARKCIMEEDFKIHMVTMDSKLCKCFSRN